MNKVAFILERRQAISRSQQMAKVICLGQSIVKQLRQINSLPAVKTRDALERLFPGQGIWAEI